jgi:hypothetical protein
MRGTTPMETSRLVDLEVLLGKRGLEGRRAVRLDELNKGLAENRNITRAAKELSADLYMPAASTWYSGPSISIARGIWLINAVAQFRVFANGDKAVRIFDGALAYMAAQQTHLTGVDYQFQLHLSGIVSVADRKTLTLQATSTTANASQRLSEFTTLTPTTAATQISAVQIGA